MIYGKNLIIQGSPEAAQVLAKAYEKFKILNGAISEGKPIYDGFLKKTEALLLQT